MKDFYLYKFITIQMNHRFLKEGGKDFDKEGKHLLHCIKIHIHLFSCH